MAAVAVIFLSARTVIVNLDPPGIKHETTQVDRVRTMTSVRIKGVAPDSGVNYTIESQTLKQFPDRNLSELKKPYIVQTSLDGVSRIIHADFAEFDEANSVIVLKGNAKVSTKTAAGEVFEVVNADQYTISLNYVNE